MPPVDNDGSIIPPVRISPPPPIDPTLNPDPVTTGGQAPGTSTQNETAESIDANFVLIGAAVVLGVILLTTGKD